MSELSSTAEIKEVKPAIVENYRNIKPDKEMSVGELNDSVKEEFNKVKNDIKSDLKDNIQDEAKEKEINQPIKNKIDGLAREHSVFEDLISKYPGEKGYEIVPEVYLRNENGEIVKDPVSGEARRIDFVVVRGEKVVDSVEVTSLTADKTEQSAKEGRIRDLGGNFIKNSEGNFVEIPRDVSTRIERRE